MLAWTCTHAHSCTYELVCASHDVLSNERTNCLQAAGVQPFLRYQHLAPAGGMHKALSFSEDMFSKVCGEGGWPWRGQPGCPVHSYTILVPARTPSNPSSVHLFLWGVRVCVCVRVHARACVRGPGGTCTHSCMPAQCGTCCVCVRVCACVCAYMRVHV